MTKKAVFLRGLDPELVRNAKSQAALRDLSLSGYVTLALENQLRLESGVALVPETDGVTYNSAALQAQEQ